MQQLSQAKRIKKILEIVKQNKVALIEGKMDSPEEGELIRETMELIDESFKGIEVASISGLHEDASFMTKLRYRLVGTLLGNQVGLTIIGPAHLVSEIKQDPDKMQLFLSDKKIKRRGKR